MSQPLRVAIVHYHLKRGGVTRVVESTLRGFDASDKHIQTIVLAGEVPADFAYQDRAKAIPGLRYENAQSHPPSAKALLDALKEAAISALGALPEIWHIHNHSLGKNTAMAGVISLLAEEGAAMLLQMHDFAEDGRPANYQLIESASIGTDKLYPRAARVHYAVLNQRDLSNFKHSGVSGENLHCLPNPIESDTPVADPERTQAILDSLHAERLILYPVRAVRRKNFGELLLWATCAEKGEVFANTLGPTNQNYQAAYQNWRTCAESNQLPIRFSIGENNQWSFPEIMGAADCVITTSIAEGFGLGFLEPWLFGKSIVGRDLPDITADFKTAGLELDALYPSLDIPTEWLDFNELTKALRVGLENAYRAYDIPLPETAIEQALSAISTRDTIDFGGLNEPLQQKVLQTVCASPENQSYLRKQLHFPRAKDLETVQHNQKVCETHFGLPAYIEHLDTLYRQIANTTVHAVEYLDAPAFLQAFLKPENFRLLRT